MGKVQLLRRGDAVSDIKNVTAVVHWMIRNVPCFLGRVPSEWTDAVFESLEKQGASDYVIEQSFKFAITHGYDFGDIQVTRMFGRVTWQYKYALIPLSPVPVPSMGQAEPMTLERAKRIAAIFEGDYEIAQINDDYSAQASLLKGFMELVRRVAAAIMIGRAMKPGQDSADERRGKAGEQLRLGPGRTSGGAGGGSGGGGDTEAFNGTAEQLRPSAPQVTNDATNLVRMGVRVPTARDVETRIAPFRPPSRRGSRSGRNRNSR